VNQMDDIQRTLGELLANQKSFMISLEKHIEDDKELSARITKIEAGWAYAGGIVMSIGVAVSFIINALLRKMGLT